MRQVKCIIKNTQAGTEQCVLLVSCTRWCWFKIHPLLRTLYSKIIFQDYVNKHNPPSQYYCNLTNNGYRADSDGCPLKKRTSCENKFEIDWRKMRMKVEKGKRKRYWEIEAENVEVHQKKMLQIWCRRTLRRWAIWKYWSNKVHTKAYM